MIAAITSRAIALVASGMSPSDATALVVMGKSVSPGAIQRIELIASAYLRRLEAECAVRRCA